MIIIHALQIDGPNVFVMENRLVSRNPNLQARLAAVEGANKLLISNSLVCLCQVL